MQTLLTYYLQQGTFYILSLFHLVPELDWKKEGQKKNISTMSIVQTVHFLQEHFFLLRIQDHLHYLSLL